MLEEALGVLRALLTTDGRPASFRGRWYRAEDAPVMPGPASGPGRRCGSGARATVCSGVVARAADGWNICWSMTEAAYQERAWGPGRRPPAGRPRPGERAPLAGPGTP